MARLRIEKRRGKPVTVAALEMVPAPDLKPLAKELRRLLGTGGTVTGTTMELQGDHLQRLRDVLRARGMLVKG